MPGMNTSTPAWHSEIDQLRAARVVVIDLSHIRPGCAVRIPARVAQAPGVSLKNRPNRMPPPPASSTIT